METKWTKGPWCVEDPETDERPGWSWISAVVPGWYGLAEVVTRMDGDTEDSPVGRANANLIAAAPDLYEALCETLEIARRNEAGDYVQRAEAALAKARGE